MIAETLIVSLVAYRVWRLLAVDSLTTGLRDRLSTRWFEFVACSWCLGFWITLLVGLTVSLSGMVDMSPWLLIPAASVIVGYLGERI